MVQWFFETREVLLLSFVMVNKVTILESNMVKGCNCLSITSFPLSHKYLISGYPDTEQLMERSFGVSLTSFSFEINFGGLNAEAMVV